MASRGQDTFKILTLLQINATQKIERKFTFYSRYTIFFSIIHAFQELILADFPKEELLVI